MKKLVCCLLTVVLAFVMSTGISADEVIGEEIVKSSSKI